MSSTLSSLKTRLSEVLKRSETRNLTDTQRERAINDALIFDVANYRPWTRLVENAKTQAVDGVIRIPSDFRKLYSLYYGNSPESNWEMYTMVDQTKFLSQINNTVTITEENDVQIMKIYPDDDIGVDQENQTSDTDLGLYSASGQEYLYQTFTTETTTFKGCVVKLKLTGSPTGTLTCGLYATSSSAPTGSALATDSLTIENELTSSYQYVYFNLPYTTTEDTEYAIVLSTDATSADASNYVTWEYSATSQIDDGTRGVYDGASYATATGDMYFLTYEEVFTIQYSKRLVAMTESTDTTGLDSEFDEAIVMLAAARLLLRQAGGQDQTNIALANDLKYGTTSGGNMINPTPDSAYGKLNIIWDEYRVRDRFPRRKMSNIYEKYGVTDKAHVDKSYLNYM